MEDRLNNQAGMVSPLGENGVIFNARGYFLTALEKKTNGQGIPYLSFVTLVTLLVQHFV